MPMEPTRRRQLEERRRELPHRLRRQERRNLLSFELDALDRLGVPYELVFETEELWRWLNAHFPTTSTSIDWERVAVCRCRHAEYGTPAAAGGVPAALAARVHRERVGPEDRVEVLYLNGRSPALRVRWADVLAHGETLVWWSSEAWVLCRPGCWVLEYVSGERWCWGRAAAGGPSPSAER